MQVCQIGFMPIEEENLQIHAYIDAKLLPVHLILACISRSVFLLTPNCHSLGHILGLSLI